MLAGSSSVSSKQIPIITLLLIVANIIVFAKVFMADVGNQSAHRSEISVFYEVDGELMFEQGNDDPTEADKLVDQYGFQMDDIANHDYVSLLSHMFVHDDVQKFVGNIVAIWVISIALEELFGMGTFCVFYLLCGIGSCLINGFSNMDATTPLIGASGAIAGMMGAFLVLFGGVADVKLLRFSASGARSTTVPAPVFIALWLMSQLMEMEEASVFNVDTGVVALMAGFAIGAVVAFVLKGDLMDRISLDDEGKVDIASTQKVVIPEEKLLQEVLECSPFAQVVEQIGDTPIGCPQCNEPLDLKNPLGERLVRCTNRQCCNMVYVDGDLLAAHLAEPLTMPAAPTEQPSETASVAV